MHFYYITLFLTSIQWEIDDNQRRIGFSGCFAGDLHMQIDTSIHAMLTNMYVWGMTREILRSFAMKIDRINGAICEDGISRYSN